MKLLVVDAEPQLASALAALLEPWTPGVTLPANREAHEVARAAPGRDGSTVLVDVDDALLPALLMLLAHVESTREAVPRAPWSHPSRSLTHRQRAVLSRLCDGSANKDIGRALHISEKTVKTHMSAIFKALGVTNRTQAAVAARESQLLEG